MSKNYENTCSMTQKELIDEYFMEYRAQLLDVAAFLDRMERSVEQNGSDDFRYKAMLEAIQVLAGNEPERVERMQMILSDRDTRLLEERDSVSAYGAVDTSENRKRTPEPEAGD